MPAQTSVRDKLTVVQDCVTSVGGQVSELGTECSGGVVPFGRWHQMEAHTLGSPWGSSPSLCRTNIGWQFPGVVALPGRRNRICGAVAGARPATEWIACHDGYPNSPGSLWAVPVQVNLTCGCLSVDRWFQELSNLPTEEPNVPCPRLVARPGLMSHEGHMRNT